MAKLKLSFKDRKLKVFSLPETECLLGRDPACDIPIDSLAIQPQHARIYLDDGQYRVEPVTPACAISVGDQPVTTAHTLEEGDRLQIGKHCLVFSAEGDSRAAAASVTPLPSSAWLQIQSGPHLGRTIRLNKAFTRVGKPQGELAVIAHRDAGYFLSTLHGEQGAQVNDQAIGDQARRLENADCIAIGELQLQFFSDGVAAQSSAVAPSEQADVHQRQFSRIPFEVDVTLQHEGRQWQSGLLDISLHGALIRTPEAFQVAPDVEYRLEVHLEGGPDISMAVDVAHQEEDRLGLHCTHIDVDSITHLRRLVELNLGDPEMLERELSSLG